MQKKLLYFISLSYLVTLSACGGGGGGASAAAPNSINGSWTNLSYNGTATTINSLAFNGGQSVLYLISGNESIVWQYSFSANTWQALPNLSQVATAIMVNSSNSSNTLYAGLANGNVYYLVNNSWSQLGSSTESSVITSMVAQNSTLYVANQAGHVWSGLGGAWTNITASGGYSESGPIVQIVLNNNSTASYLGAASGPNIWAYNINTGNWTNLMAHATSGYTDSGSSITHIQFYAQNQLNYGYFSNTANHVWSVVANLSTGTVASVVNMTSYYPGYTDSSASITSLLVDNANDVYVGTSNGQLWLWTPSTLAWSNLASSSSFNGGNYPITALALSTAKQTVYVGNGNAQVWQVNW